MWKARRPAAYPNNFQSFRVKGDVKTVRCFITSSRAHSVNIINNAMRKNYLLIIIWFLTSVSADGQDSTKTTVLDELVVSATRTEQPIIEVPRSVTVIHDEEIRNSVYQSLGDLLNTQSGLFVSGANQTPGTNQNVFMRGANSNQVAVLIDGVRITDPSTPNAAIDLSEISLVNIERIEVIRGSHSTIFGGSAVGGVINLITKKRSSAGLHGSASWQGGTFGKSAWLSNENVSLNYGLKDGLYFNGAVFRQDVSGLDASEKREDLPSFTADRDDFEKLDGSVTAGFRNERWDANASFRKSNQQTDIDNGAYLDDDNSYLRFDRELLQYYSAYKINPVLRLALLGSLTQSERFFENDSSRVNETTWDKSYSKGSYYGKLQTHELQMNFQREKVRAVVGAGLYAESMFFESYFLYNDPVFPFESTIDYDSLDPRATTHYVFAQAGYDLGKFHLSGGARYSSHSNAGEVVTFDVNPSYTSGDLLIYASASTAFNAPSLYQLYDPSKGFTAYTTRGNGDLVPERSLSFEAGVKRQFNSGSYFTLSAYQTRVSDAIEYVYLWNGEKPQQALDYSDDRGDTYINIAKQVVNGIEADASINFNTRLSLDANVSLLKAQVRANKGELDVVHTGGHHVQLYNLGVFLAQDVEQKDVVRRPSFTAYSKVAYRLMDNLTLHLVYRYTGHRFDAGYDGTLGPYGALARIDVDAFHLFDIGAYWQPTRKLSVAVKVENVLDADYREVVGFHTRGRSVYLKLGVRW
jgi:vitamin B12 transporter